MLSLAATLALTGLVLDPDTELFSAEQGDYAYLGQSMAASGDTLVVGAYKDDPLRSGAVYVWVCGPGGWVAQARLGNPQLGLNEEFGTAVAIDGDTLIGGAPGNPGFPGIFGAAHVYRRSAGTWTLEASLAPPVPTDRDEFGAAVVLSGDLALVGAPGADGDDGALYAFTRSGATWSAGTRLDPVVGKGFFRFGSSLALDGGTLLVGEPRYGPFGAAFGPGVVHVFTGAGTGWSSQGILTAPGGVVSDRFGASVALLGDEAVVGAPGLLTPQGARAYVFERTGSSWSLGQELFSSIGAAGDAFGTSLALTPELLVVGAPLSSGTAISAGTVVTYARDGRGPGWVEAELLQDSSAKGGERLGTSVATLGPAVLGGAPRADLGPIQPGLNQLEALEFVDELPSLVAYHSQSLLIDVEEFPGSFVLSSVASSLAAAGLAYDPGAQLLYAADTSPNELWSIEPLTGVATLAGNPTVSGIAALAFDAATGILYGLSKDTDELITIDPSTAVCTPVGPLGFVKSRGLAVDASTGTMWGCSNNDLYTIDPVTGLGTLRAAFGFDSLCFDPTTNLLMAVQSNRLWSIDPQDYERTDLGPLYREECGVVLVFEPEPVQTYCTAGTSASGCTASIGGAGTPSATAPSGFDLTADGVEGSKRGLFFYGTGGRQAAPWGNSTSYQCVAPPVKRTTLQQENGTTGACDGYYSFDLNAWFQAKPAANPGAGQLVQAQFWYRDPFAATNVKTSLSDALEFTLGL